MLNRIRIISSQGWIAVAIKTKAEALTMLKGLTKEQQDGFWNKQETKLVNGDSIYLTREGDE